VLETESAFLVHGRVRKCILRTLSFRIGASEVVFYGIDEGGVQRKKSEEKARHAGIYNRSLIEASLDPLVTIGADGSIRDVNEATVRITGVARENLIGTDFSSYFSDPEKARTGYETAFREGIVQDYALGIRHRNGTVTPVLYNATVFRDESGNIAGVFAAARDITEHTRIVDALTETERRYRELTELLPQTIFECDLQGTLTFINRAGVEFFQYTDGDLRKGLSLFAVIPPEDRERVRTNVARKMRGEQFSTEEYRAMRKDGSVVPILVYSSPILRGNRPVGLRGIVVDITPLKKTAEELRVAHQNLTDIIEFLPDATFVIDAEKNVVAWNRAMVELTGVPKEDMLGAGDFAYAVPFYGEKRPILIDLIDTDDATTGRLYESIQRHGRTLIGETFLPRFRNGQGVYLWGKASPLYDGEGRITGSIETIRDVTERRIAERTVSNQKQQLQNLMENLPVGLFRCSLGPDSTFVMANPMVTKMFGYDSADAMRSVRVAALFADDQQMVQFLAALHANGSIMGAEYLFRKKDGQTFWGRISATVIRDSEDGVTGFDGVIEDITVIKQSSEAIRNSEKKYRAVVENASEAIVVAQAGVLKFTNGRMSELTGYSIEELKTIPYSALVHPEDRHILEEWYQRKANDAAKSAKYTLRIMGKNGAVRWMEVHTVDILWEKNPATLDFLNDISEQTKAKLDLQSVEGRFRRLVEVALEGIWVIDPLGMTVYANPRLSEILGYTKEELQGKSFLDLMTDGQILLQSEIGAGNYHKNGAYEVGFTRKDGTPIFTGLQVSPIKDASGRVTGALALVSDITESKLSRNALISSERRYKDLSELLPVAVFELDFQGKVTYLNQKGLAWFGYTEEDLQGGVHVSRFVWDQQIALMKERMDKILRGEKLKGTEYVMQKKDGTLFPALVYSSPTFGVPEKDTIGIRGVVVDITELKNAEKALKESEGKFRAITETALDAIFIKDRTFRYVQVNPAMGNLFGKSPPEIVGLTDSDLYDVPTAEHIKEGDTSVIGGGIIDEETSRVINGEEIILHLIKVPMRDAAGEIAGICGIARNITERTRAEEQIRASLAEKEVLLREIHHRVKNNMQIISSMINLQSRTIQDERSRDVFRDCQGRVRTMSLVHEKIYRSGDLAHINFGDYLRSLSTQLVTSYARKGIDVKVESDDVPVGIDTAIPCGLIVNELITNALKHAFPDARNGTVRIRFSRVQGADVALTIHDDGIGFPEHFDLSASPSLGLKLVQALVKQIGGTLQIRRDHGTEFTITFRIPDEGARKGTLPAKQDC
jgi:PAS domain S-box-containing protein